MLAYRWQRLLPGESWSAIAGATEDSYTLTAADIGKQLRVEVTITDAGGQVETLHSAATAEVETAPIVTGVFLRPRPDGTDGVGDIEVSVRFPERVRVTGTPTLTLMIGDEQKTAQYVSASDETTLVFRYGVMRGDAVPGGVGIVAMRLSLPEGTSIRDRDDRDLILGHIRVMADTGHKVDTSVRSSSEEVRSKRGRRSTDTDNVAPVVAMDASRREVNAAKLEEGVPLAPGPVRVTDDVVLQTPVLVGAVVDGSDVTLIGSERGITTVVIDGSTYALVPSRSQGLQIIDISNPSSPQAMKLIAKGNGFTALREPRSVATAVIDSKTYALVAASKSNGVQIIDISNPSSPKAIAAIKDIKDGAKVGDASFTELRGAWGITTAVINGKTYALVAAKDDDGVQIIDISTPSRPQPVAAIEHDSDFTELKGATDITTVVIDGSTYALVAAKDDDGVQIIDISTPSRPQPAAAIEHDSDFTKLKGATDITTVTVEGRVYALVAAKDDDGVQIIDISNPSAPQAVVALEDGKGGFTELRGAFGITTVVVGGRTYALVAARGDAGVQIIDISDPSDPQAVAALEDGKGGFDSLKGAVGVTTVTVEGRVYALVTAYEDDAVQFIELPVSVSIASIKINTQGLEAADEQLLYGSGSDDFLAIGGGANTDKTGVAIAGIDGLELAWSASDKSITIRKVDNSALTTVQTEAIIAALRYTHGDADNAAESERVFTFVLRDTAGNETASARQASVSVEVDKTPPAAPTLALNEDTGDSTSDRVTSNGAFTVSGVEADATWEYSVDGGAKWQPGSGSSFTVAPGRYSSNKIQVRQTDRAENASVAGEYPDTLEVVPVPSTRVAITAITDDTGDGGDFITEDNDGLVLHARLSAPLKSGERLEYATSTDGGSTWSGWIDISASVSGEGVVHEDTLLTGSARVRLRVVNSAGEGEIAEQLITIRSPAGSVPVSISGIARQGEELSVNVNASGITASGYQWQRELANGSWEPVSGETGETYTLVQADVGRRIRVQVTGTQSGSSVTFTSAVKGPVVNVNDLPQAADDTVRAKPGQPRVMDSAELTENDKDPDGDKLTVVDVGSAVNGVVSIGSLLVQKEVKATPGRYLQSYDGHKLPEGIVVQGMEIHYTVTLPAGHGLDEASTEYTFRFEKKQGNVKFLGTQGDATNHFRADWYGENVIIIQAKDKNNKVIMVKDKVFVHFASRRVLGGDAEGLTENLKKTGMFKEELHDIGLEEPGMAFLPRDYSRGDSTSDLLTRGGFTVKEPRMLITGKGTLLVASHWGRHSPVNSRSAIEQAVGTGIVVSRSDDHGNTWYNTLLVQDGMEFWGYTGMVELEKVVDGVTIPVIHLYALAGHRKNNHIDGVNVNRRGNYRFESTDDGRTWSEPVRHPDLFNVIFANHQSPDGNRANMPAGDMVGTSVTTKILKVPGLVLDDETAPEGQGLLMHTYPYGYIFASIDGGENWKKVAKYDRKSPSVNFYNRMLNEVAWTVLDNNAKDIYMIFRKLQKSGYRPEFVISREMRSGNTGLTIKGNHDGNLRNIEFRRTHHWMTTVSGGPHDGKLLYSAVGAYSPDEYFSREHAWLWISDPIKGSDTVGRNQFDVARVKQGMGWGQMAVEYLRSGLPGTRGMGRDAIVLVGESEPIHRGTHQIIEIATDPASWRTRRSLTNERLTVSTFIFSWEYLDLLLNPVSEELGFEESQGWTGYGSVRRSYSFGQVTDTDNNVWNGTGGARLYKLASDARSGEHSLLLSFNTSARQHVTLDPAGSRGVGEVSFYVRRFAATDDPVTLEVESSTDGVNWTRKYRKVYQGLYEVPSVYTKVTVPVNERGDVKLRISVKGAKGLHLDDLTYTDYPGVGGSVATPRAVPAVPYTGIVFTPAESGRASSFEYTVSDGTLTATAAVTVGLNNAPVGSVALPGNTQVGDKLIADTSGITDSDGLTKAVFRYQWQRSTDGGITWEDIIDETFDDYTVVSTDTTGVQLRVQVSYRDDLGTAETVASSVATVVTTSTAPTMTGTDITSSGPYLVGDVIEVTVTYNEAVVVDEAGGTPSLTLVVGTTERQAEYDSGTGSNRLVFRYTFEAGETDEDGVSVRVDSLSFNSGTIQDGAGNAASLRNEGVTDDSSQVVDATPSVVTGTKVTSSGPYEVGDFIEVTVTYDDAVVVDTTGGTPSLTLVVGRTHRQALYHSVTGNKLVFRYTFVAGETDEGGVSVRANSLALNGGMLKDRAGNGALLTHAGVDAIAPVLVMDASRRKVNAAKLGEGVPLATGAVRVTDDVVLQAPVPTVSVTNRNGFGLHQSYNGVTTVVIDGSTYALVPSRTRGLQIIDISDPSDPKATKLIARGKRFTALTYPRSVATAVVDGKTYALVAASGSHGVQIIDISTPASPKPVAAIIDGAKVGDASFTELRGAWGITTAVIDGKTYALVAAKDDDGVQIIDISTPSRPKPVAAVKHDSGFTELKGATDITTVVIAGSTYALVAAAADNGVQIIDISTPSRPKPVAAIEHDSDFTELKGATDITTVVIAGSTYALVAAAADNGVQIIDISDPSDPQAVAELEDGKGGFNRLKGAVGVTTVVVGGRTYALVAARGDAGVQVIDISDPSDPQAVAALEDGKGGFNRLKGAVGVTTVTVEGRVYALVTAYSDNAVQFIELPVLESIASIEINTQGLEATNEQLRYGSGSDDVLEIGGQADIENPEVAIAGIDGLKLAWSVSDNSITIRKADNSALTTIEAETIIAALRYTHGDADNAGEGERVFTFVLRDTADNETALNQQVGVSVEVDKTPPAAPTLALNEDTGDSASDRVTSNGAFTVSDVDAGATWEYSFDGGVKWQPGSGSSFTVAPGRYSSNRIQVRQTDRAGNASVAGEYPDTLEVLPVPSTRVAITAITDDTGEGGDFITEDNDGLVLHARLSAPLKAGERLEYATSTDSGSTWSGWADISTSVFGVRVAHEDRLLTGSPRVRLRVVNSAGSGEVAEQLITISPASEVPVSISGIARQGEELSVNASGITASGYQWQRELADGSWEPVSEATGATYTLVQADVGRRIRVQVTGTQSGSSEKKTFISAIKGPVVNVNDTPQAANDEVVAKPGQPRVMDPAELTENDKDPDGDKLTVTAVDNAVNGVVSIGSLLVQKEVKATPGRYLQSYAKQKLPGGIVVQGMEIHYTVTLPEGHGLDEASTEYTFRFEKKQGNVKFLGRQGEATNHFRADWYGENVIIIQAKDKNNKVIMVKDKVFVHFASRRIMGGDAEGLTKSQRNNAFRDAIHDIGKNRRGMAFLPRDHSRGDPDSGEMKKGFYFVKEPRLLTTSKGTLLATHHIAKRADPGEVRVGTDANIGQGIAVSRSTDHGNSWDGEILVQQKRNHWGYTAMVEVEEDHNGKKVDAIYMYVSAGHPGQSIQPWANVDYRGIYYFKSIDDGVTWTGPTEHVGLNKVVLKGRKPISRDGIKYGNVPGGIAPTTNILKVPGLVLDGQTAPEGQGLLMHTYAWGYMHASIDGGTTWKKVADHNACGKKVELHNEVAWEVLDNDNQDIYMLFRETGFQGSGYRYTYKPEYVITREMTSSTKSNHCGLTFRAKHGRSLGNVPGNSSHHWMDVVPQGPDKGTLLFSNPGSRIAYARYHAWLWVSKEPITGEKTITRNLFQTPARVKHDVGWGQSAVEYLKSGLSNTRDMGKDAIVLVGESEPIHKDTHQIIDLKPNTYTGDKFSDERFTATTFVLSWEYLELLLNPVTGAGSSVTPPAVPYTGIVFTPDTSGRAGSFEYTVSDGALTDKGRVTVGLNKAPVGSVALPGNTQVGDKLIADTSGITDGDGLTKAVFRYQWQRTTDGGITWKDIIDETFDDYTVVSTDTTGVQLRVLVSYRDDLGTAEAVTSTAATVVTTPTAPTMTGTKITSSGLYLVGDVIEVAVTYNEAVLVDTKDGTPSLTLVVGTTDRQALYAGGTGSNRLVFRYTFEAGETDEDGVSVRVDSLSFNSGKIQDGAGNAASLRNEGVTADISQVVDATPPVVTGTEITSSGPYEAGDFIKVTVTYDDAVVVDTTGGTPSLTLVVGRTHRQAVYHSVTGNKLVFRYTFEAGETDEGGVSVRANSLALNGGMLKDRAGNGALLTHAGVDAIAPVLVTDAPPRKVNAAKLGEGVPLATGPVRVTDDVVLQAPVPTMSVTNGNGFGLHQSYSGVTTVVIGGKTYALVPSRTRGLQIIDISNPSSPQATKLIAKGNGFTALREPRSVATAVIDSKTYALVAASGSHGVQIIDISDPSSPKAIAAIKDIKDGAKVGDASFTELRGAWGITTAVIDGKTYALVAAKDDDGVQIIDISTPSDPQAVVSLEDGEDGFTKLRGATDITTVRVEGRVYALVAAAADNGVQIIDISDPSDPQAVAAIKHDSDFTELKGATDITTVVIAGSTYALVAAAADNGVQIIDISDPSDPQAVVALEDGKGGFSELRGAFGITTVVVGGWTYALVAARGDAGVQIIDISDPSDPQAVAELEDGKGGFNRLKGAVGVTTVTVEGRVYALVTAYSDNAVQLIELPVSASIASIEINTEGLEATGEKLLYGSRSDDVLEIGGQADIKETKIAIAGINGLRLRWHAASNSIRIERSGSVGLTTVQTEAIIAALRYTHGDADNAGEGERVFTFVLRDMAGNVTALNKQVSVSVELDKTPPAAPTLALNEDTGDDASDGVTSNGAFTVSGVDADATWEYSVDGGAKWQPGSGSSFTVAPGRYSSNRIQVRQVDRAGNASVAGEYSDALEVVPVPSTRVAITAITDDTGKGGDFITEDDDGLVLHARLSAPLKAGERLEYATSTDGGSTWSGWADISTSVFGVRVVHEDRSLTGIVMVGLRVVDHAGAGEIAEQLITIRSPADSAPVSISGIARQNEILMATAPGITDTGYQWQRELADGNWEPVSGATEETYTLVQADVGRRIRVQVTGTQSGSPVTFTSAVKGPVVNVDDPPQAADDEVVAKPGQPRVMDPAELTENDKDPDGDELTLVDVGSAVNGVVSIGSLLVQKDVKAIPGRYLQSYAKQKLPEAMVVQGMEIHYSVTLPEGHGLDEASTKYTFRFEKKQGNVKFLGTQGDATNHFRADWYGENVIIIQAKDKDNKVIMVKDKVFVHFASRRIMAGDAEGLTKSQRNNMARDAIHDIGENRRGMAFLPRDHSRGDPVSEEMKRGFYFVKEPRLLTTSKGTLLVTHHIGRRTGPGEVRVNTDSHIGQGIALSRSTDHGHSWNGQILVQQNRNHWGYTAMVEVEEDHNGKKVDAIYVYVSAGSFNHNTRNSLQPWNNVDYRGIYYFKSIDDGATWTEPIEHVGLNKVVLKGLKPVTRGGITYGNIPPGVAPSTNILKVPGLVLDGQTAPEGRGLLLHTHGWGHIFASIDGGTTWKRVSDYDACPGVNMHNELAWEVLDNDDQDIYMLFRNHYGDYKREYVLTREMTSATGSGKHCGLTFRAKHDRSLGNVRARTAHHWLTVVPQGPDKGTLLFTTPGSRTPFKRYHAWLWVSREPITGEKTITSNLFHTPARVKHDIGWGQNAVEYLKSGLSNTRDMGKDAIVLVGESEPIHKDTHQIIDLKPDKILTGDKFADERFTATTFVLSREYLELLLNPVTGAGSSVTPPAVPYTGIVFTPDESGIAGSFEYTVSDGVLTDKGRVTVGLNNAPVGSVALPGKTQVGDKLIADTSGITDGDGLTRAVFRYQWQSSTDGGNTWKDIIDETFDDYTVVSTDTIGVQLRVLVSYRDDLGTAETVASTVATVVTTPTAPTMTGTKITSSGPYLVGDVIEVTVTYNEAVVVDTKDGTPSLTLEVGSDERQALYADGTGSNKLVFRYRVQSGETDTDGVVVKANSLTLSNGTIQDGAGNTTMLGHSGVLVNSNHAVDAAPPTVTGTEITSNGPYKAGDVIEVTVTYNEAVVVDMAGGTPSLTLVVGRTHRQALYADGTGNKLVFRYTFVAGETDEGGVSVRANSLVLNGGMLKDRAGNGALLTHAGVDAIAPVLVTDAPPRKVNAAKLGEGVPLATGPVRVTDDVVLQAPVSTVSVTNRNGFGLHQSYSGVTTVVIDGSTYALVPSRSQGLQIIDISDPSSPQATKLIARGKRFTALREPRSVATAVIDSKTYALVAASKSNGVQIIDISNPSSPKAIAAIKDIKDGAKVGDASFTELRGAWGITTAVIDGKTYALVAAKDDNGVQIIDISIPSRPKPVAAIKHDSYFTELKGATDITTVVIAGSTYALVAAAADNGVQIIDISTPSRPKPVAAIEHDSDFTELKGATDITTVTVEGRVYALVAAKDDDGVQIIDISNPSAPQAVVALEDGKGGFTELRGAFGITTVVVGGRTYALVAARGDAGVQVINISDPSDPQAVAALEDGKGGFNRLKGAVGVTTVTVEGRVYALVTAYNDNAVEFIELPVLASIASIEIKTRGLGAAHEQLRYGAGMADFLAIGGGANTEKTGSRHCGHRRVGTGLVC